MAVTVTATVDREITVPAIVTIYPSIPVAVILAVSREMDTAPGTTSKPIPVAVIVAVSREIV